MTDRVERLEKIATTDRAVGAVQRWIEAAVRYLDSRNEQTVSGVLQSSGDTEVLAGSGWSIREVTSSYVEIALDAPFESADGYRVDAGVDSDTHRFVVTEYVDASTFRLRVWNASAVNIDPSTTALRIGFAAREVR